MLCYKDRTYCSEKTCINKDCYMLFTREMGNDANVWWNQDEEDLSKWKEAPVAMSEFRDTEFCPGYKSAPTK